MSSKTYPSPATLEERIKRDKAKAAKSARQDRPEPIATYSRAYDLFDFDGTDSIDASELTVLLQ